MTFTLVHIVAGLSAILAGAVALSVTKGGAVHRKAGLVFVATMTVMASLGAIIAAGRLHLGFQKFNVMAGLFTVYLVTTALLAVRQDARRPWMDYMALAVALGIALFGLGSALLSLSAPTLSWFPLVPATIFGTVALLAAIGDMRMLRSGPPHGKKRLVRHLWRMCTAMFIATGSFFAGQSKIFSEEYRNPIVMFTPMLLVLGSMAYWWIRTSWTRRSPAPRIHAVAVTHPSS